MSRRITKAEANRNFILRQEKGILEGKLVKIEQELDSLKATGIGTTAAGHNYLDWWIQTNRDPVSRRITEINNILGYSCSVQNIKPL